jgi:hypothetical protein
VAVLALGEAAERPVAAKPEIENLTKNVIAPEIERFALSTSENLPIARDGAESGRFYTRVHAPCQSERAGVRPPGRRPCAVGVAPALAVGQRACL